MARKQYTELKDSGGRPDEVVADEAWVQHVARDHSIITDLFYGQLKSKVTCQTCGHESVRFDPFNLLSLPLPMESYILCEVLVVRLDGNTPVKYGLRLNSEAKYIELKQQLSKLCHINVDRLLLAEVAYCQILKILTDSARIDASTATELYGYELPGDNQQNGGLYYDGPKNEVEEGNFCLSLVKLNKNCFFFVLMFFFLIDKVVNVTDSPLARSPEVRGGSALCMPNILCFKVCTRPTHLFKNRKWCALFVNAVVFCCFRKIL